MNEISIGERTIGTDSPVLVIAEIGVNHDGSVERALKLVSIAAAAGADAVKLQVFRADRLMNRTSAFAEYQRDRVNDADPIAMLRRFELSDEAVGQITAKIQSLGLIPIATPFSPEDVPLLERLNLPAIKIASPDLVNLPLLKTAGRSGKPLLVSTGAATIAEVQRTVGWLIAWGVPFALLHCTSSYPVEACDTNLSWIGELADRFDVPAGFSDHTTDVLSGALAVAAGACVIEKHLTYDRSADGPDHSASADPSQFADYVKLIRSAESLRGKPGKRLLRCEEDVRTVSRQSLVITRTMAPGEIITEACLAVQRPGTGIPASEIDRILGRRVRVAISAGTMLSLEMLVSPSNAAAA
jgi:N-acetylneuraminate synthase/N,N'-diacetyllegionaminate synthase